MQAKKGGCSTLSFFSFPLQINQYGSLNIFKYTKQFSLFFFFFKIGISLWIKAYLEEDLHSDWLLKFETIREFHHFPRFLDLLAFPTALFIIFLKNKYKKKKEREMIWWETPPKKQYIYIFKYNFEIFFILFQKKKSH